MHLLINGEKIDINADPRLSLLELLRDELHLYGTKLGCNQGGCGACTVLLEGRRVLSCLTLAAQCEGQSIVTIEGISSGQNLHPLQQAFINHDGFQCGYCTPGQICSAIGMVEEISRGVPSVVSFGEESTHTELTDAEIRERMSGNICRCGAYNGIIAAIRASVSGEDRP